MANYSLSSFPVLAAAFSLAPPTLNPLLRDPQVPQADVLSLPGTPPYLQPILICYELAWTHHSSHVSFHYWSLLLSPAGSLFLVPYCQRLPLRPSGTVGLCGSPTFPLSLGVIFMLNGSQYSSFWETPGSHVPIVTCFLNRWPW